MANPWYSNQSQVFWTCKALLEGRSINHMDEIGEAKGWRLGAIIHRLRRHYDWPIDTDYRGPERIAHYSLRSDADRARLKWPRSARRLSPDWDTPDAR